MRGKIVLTINMALNANIALKSPLIISYFNSFQTSHYRFSLSWPRIFPDGTKTSFNQAGIDFYDKFINDLKAAGVEPVVTLYHWDLPQGLHDRGGWASRETVDAFVRYADVVSSALGDRVKHWKTHNEPWVASFIGHRDGAFAPGHTDFTEALTAAHHILLSHGRSMPVIRENVPDAEVGIVIDCRPSTPASDAPEDIAAQRHFDNAVSKDPALKEEVEKFSWDLK